MNPLEQIIIEKIRREGPITFETFMDMALYYPELGFYASSESVIGRDGDFFTGPHLHPVFGAMIGRQLYEMWQLMGGPVEFHVVEMGAGHGYLARDIFDFLQGTPESVSAFLDSIKYIIVEPYAHFEKKQRVILEGSRSREEGGERIRWVKAPSELKDIRGCVLSNELLDAFPVHLVKMNGSVREIYVNYGNGKFFEEMCSVSSHDITDYFTMFSIDLSPGYKTEINLRIKKWLRNVAAFLTEGFVLTIDYGYSAREYFSDDRTGGTLLCYHKHTLNDSPYRNIGRQDITAHVNFSSLKMWGDDLGLKTVGYCPQGTFLTAAGIDEVIVECYSDSADYLSELSRIKRLIFPQGMGESHNVMIQYRGDNMPSLRGFSMRNQRDLL